MQRIESFGVIQTSKVMGVLFFAFGLLLELVILTDAIVTRRSSSAGYVMALTVPIGCGFIGSVSSATLCCLYNAVARAVGGIEIEIVRTLPKLLR